MGRLKKTPQLPVEAPVDFVVTWVDDSDELWQKEKNKYDNNLEGNGPERYRDWNQLKYWFRSVEKYAPWVRKIHFVTYGHYPEWLNLENEKINLVNHKDFIPQKYLPTFNSNAIELNLCRIEGLSEQFVYFNDDMYLNRPTEKEDFFSGGKPKYCNEAIPYRHYRKKEIFDYSLFNTIGLVNDYFDITRVMYNNPEIWFNKKNKSSLKYHRLSFRDNYLYGMAFTHLGMPMKKSTMEMVWKTFGDELDETSQNKFRTPFDIWQQIFHLWDIMNGNCYHVNHNYFGKLYENLKGQLDLIREDIINEKSLMICLNDSADLNENDFNYVKSEIDKIFMEKYPNKSSYEK